MQGAAVQTPFGQGFVPPEPGWDARCGVLGSLLRVSPQPASSGRLGFSRPLFGTPLFTRSVHRLFLGGLLQVLLCIFMLLKP